MLRVIPSAAGDRRKVSAKAWVVPAITAVSKPNRSPPSAATTVLFRRYELSFIGPFKIATIYEMPSAWLLSHILGIASGSLLH